MRSRRGMALVAVLAIMGLLAMMALGGLAATHRLREGARLSGTDASLLAASEYGINTLLADWRDSVPPDGVVGATRRFAVGSPSAPDPVALTVTRLSASLYWVVAGVDAPAVVGAGARRRLNVVVRIPILDSALAGIVVAAGDVTLGANVVVSTVPSSSPTCSADAAPRVVLGPRANLSDGRSSTSPLSVANRPDIGDSAALTSIAGFDTSALRRIADRIVIGGTAIVLSPSDRLTYVDGSVTIAGGSGSGILYASGHIAITSALTFTGVLVARGGIDVPGAGVVIEGAILSGPGADPAVPAAARFLGSVDLRGSSCAAQAAVASALPPRPAGGRSWAELF